MIYRDEKMYFINGYFLNFELYRQSNCAVVIGIVALSFLLHTK